MCYLFYPLELLLNNVIDFKTENSTIFLNFTF
jgi:hypothetical protein